MLTRLADGVEVDDVVHIFTILLKLVLNMVGSFSLLFYKMSVVRPDPMFCAFMESRAAQGYAFGAYLS